VAEVKDLGDNKFQWVYADVHIDYIADGKEHPFQWGGTYSVRQESPERWIFTYKQDGQVTRVNAWTLLNGGQQFKTENKETRMDGSSVTVDQRLNRIGTGSGFTGRWESQKPQVNSSDEWVIKPYGNDGLAFSFPHDMVHLEMKFDGKDYAAQGPRVIPGDTDSGKRLDAYTVQMTGKLNGKVTEIADWKVSPDGKKLTVTGHATGQKKPTVLVVEKQM
jgi:hypothetical protein